MKRGLMEWDKVELPPEELDERLSRARNLMVSEGLSALLVFGDVSEAGDLCYFANFSPYWFSAMFVLTPTADVLLTTLSARVHSWIKELSPATEIRASKSFGRDASAMLQEAGLAQGRVGVTRLDRLPFSVYKELSGNVAEVVDATALVNRLRAIPSRSEVALIRRAAQNSATALDALEVAGKKECELAAEIERRIRYGKAEDVQILVTSGSAPQTWPHVATLRPIADIALVQVFSSYKGYWAAAGRTVAASAARSEGDALAEACATIMSNIGAGTSVADITSAIRREVTAKVGNVESVLCAVMPHYCVPGIQAALPEEARLEDGYVVALRVGLAMVSGRREFYSDTFLVNRESSIRLSN